MKSASFVPHFPSESLSIFCLSGDRPFACHDLIARTFGAEVTAIQVDFLCAKAML